MDRSSRGGQRDPHSQPRADGAAGQAAAALPGGHVEGFADTFRALFRAVYADVGNGGPAEHPVYPTFAEGHDEMLVGDAVAASARDGRWTAVDRERVAPVRDLQASVRP